MKRRDFQEKKLGPERVNTLRNRHFIITELIDRKSSSESQFVIET